MFVSLSKERREGNRSVGVFIITGKANPMVPAHDKTNPPRRKEHPLSSSDGEKTLTDLLTLKPRATSPANPFWQQFWRSWGKRTGQALAIEFSPVTGRLHTPHHSSWLQWSTHFSPLQCSFASPFFHRVSPYPSSPARLPSQCY